VMMELGYMRWARKENQPVIVLQRAGSGGHNLADLAGVIRIPYPAASGNYALSEITKVLKVELAKDQGIQKLNTTKQCHYLSPLLLSNKFRVEDQTAKIISEAYVTMENFVVANVDDIRRKAPDLSRGVANGLKEDVADLLKEMMTTK